MLATAIIIIEFVLLEAVIKSMFRLLLIKLNLPNDGFSAILLRISVNAKAPQGRPYPPSVQTESSPQDTLQLTSLEMTFAAQPDAEKQTQVSVPKGNEP